jgi:Domain of unknown function (DUF1844)
MPDEKKIIIDEDWKSRVEAEKEAVAKAATGKAVESTAAQGPAADAADLADVEMPPASLELLLTTLGTEALVAMGQLPHPLTGKLHAQRNQAKYLIDTIEVLRNKTKGNLTSAEQQLIDNLLHQLRMLFVQTADQPGVRAGNPTAS